jgi:hypothetical protein
VPLSQSGLASALQAVFEALPADAATAAADLAQAYYDYATQGLFGASTPTLTTGHRDAMAGTLAAAIAVPASGLPATFAGAWSAAVATFWTAVPVAGAQTGATNGCPGAAALTASLTTVFANLANTAATCAAAMAAALHTATATTTATVAPPPATVLPIT